MQDLYKLIDYLRDKEVTEEELVIIYSSYFNRARIEGFNEGCEFVRSILSRQRIARRENVKKKFNTLYGKIGDYLADEQRN